VSSASLQDLVVDALRRMPVNPSLADLRTELRKAITINSMAPVAAAIQSLRYAGKLSWDSLELSPSMAAQSAGEEPATQSSTAPVEVGDGGATLSPPSSWQAGQLTPLELAEKYGFGGNGAIVDPDEDEPPKDPYPGEVNDEAGSGPEAEQGGAGVEPVPPESPPGDLSIPVREDQSTLSQRGVEEPRSDAAANQPARVVGAEQAPAARSAAVPPLNEPKAPGGWKKASNIAGARPVPAPAHEPEIARLVREEGNEASDRRRLARSTGTVRQPLEIRKFGIPDLNVPETVTCMLAEDPQDVMRAISRKHPATWRRVILLARATGKTPMQTLYATLERGLELLEPQEQAA
jgi:hypothetical protein